MNEPLKFLKQKSTTTEYLQNTNNLIITPQMEAFLKKTQGNFELNENEIQILTDILCSPQRDRSKSFSASQSGTCLRAQVFQFLNTRPVRMVDTQLMQIFADGKWRHLIWQMFGLHAGFLKEIEVPISIPELNFRGSVDGIGLDENGEEFVFELKGTSAFKNTQRFMPYKKHKKQGMAYLLGFSKMGRHISKVVYIYEDKSNQEYKEIIMERDEDLIQEIQNDIQLMNDHLQTKTLPNILVPCIKKTGPYKDCNYRNQCLKCHSLEDIEVN